MAGEAMRSEAAFRRRMGCASLRIVLRLGILLITFSRQPRIVTIGIWSFTLRGARAHTVNRLLQECHFYKSSICEKCVGATTERDIPYVTFMAKSRLLQKAYTRHCIVYLER